MPSPQGAKSNPSLHKGLDRHLWPSGDNKGVVTKRSSDAIFGPDGLGLGGTPWSTVISWLARNGIQEQTHSEKDTTDIQNCVRGWGQGAFSSRVFIVDAGTDDDRLAHLVDHFERIALDDRLPRGMG